MAEPVVDIVEPVIPGTVEEPEVQQTPTEPVVEPVTVEEPPVTPPSEPVVEPTVEEPPTEPQPSKRENLRIQKLLERLKGQETPTVPKIPPALDYSTALDADPEVIKQIEAEAQRRQTAGYAEGLQQANSIQFQTRLEIDAPRIEAKYPILDPQAPTFDPVVSNAISQWYLATAGYNLQTGAVQNAQVRYSDFVEGIMELADVLAGEKTSQTTQTITKQAAQTGLRPGGTVAKGLNLNKDAADMTDEELDARLATVFDKK